MAKTDKPKPSQKAIDLRRRLHAALGYGNRSVKKIESMHTWEVGPGPKKHWCSCYALLTVQADGGLDLLVARAPADAAVERAVKRLGGEITEVKESVTHVLRLRVPITESGDELEQLAESFDGVPTRRQFGDRGHFFYEAPKAASYLRRFKELLTSDPH